MHPHRPIGHVFGHPAFMHTSQEEEDDDTWPRDAGQVHQASNRVKARFVSHLTYADKAKVRRNTRFTKAWLVRNDHSTPWPENTRLVSVGASAQNFGVMAPVSAPGGIAPGEVAEVCIDLTAPTRGGMYEAYFRLCDGDTGQKFGQRLWLNVNVGEETDVDEMTNEATGNTAAAVALDALELS